MSAMKKPGDNDVESVATILPAKLAILKDLMVLIPAGGAAPGTSTTRYSEKLEFNQRYLLCVYRIIIYKYRYIVLFLVHSLSFILTIYLGPKVLDIREDYHVHSSYNDHSSPDLTVKNALEKAAQIGMKTLAFTEHVRR